MEYLSDPEMILDSQDADVVNKDYLDDALSRITRNAEKNKMVILEVLKGINFSKSKLPLEFLEMREKNPFQLTGDFEKKINDLIISIEKDDLVYDFDISEIDKYLYLIARILVGAISSGCKETAIAARVSLTNGFLRVRRNLLIVQNEESRKNYLEKSIKYVKVCYSYVSVKNMIDLTEMNLDQRKKGLETETQILEKTKNDLAVSIIDDPALIDRIRSAADMTYSVSGTYWDKEIVELYEMLVNTRITESNVKFKKLCFDIEEKRLFFYRDASEKLKTYVMSVPVPEDVELFEKVDSLVSGTIQEASRIQNDFLMLNDMMDEFNRSVMALSENSKQSGFLSDAYKKVGDTIDHPPDE